MDLTAAMAVTFGSAHLLVRQMPVSTARALLDAAAAAGVMRLDTAPLYGHGGAEPLVAAVALAYGLAVTTKVGLEPAAPPPRWRSAAGGALRRLPAALQRGLRAVRPAADTAAQQAAGPSGRFGSAQVRQSIERSLARLGRIDRLLLHEVHPADIGDELVQLLAGYQHRGDVGDVGVATGNGVTLAALQRAPGLFTVAHVSVDPLGPPLPDLAALGRPSGLAALHWVGHGALGVGGRTLAHLGRRLQANATLGRRWALAVAASPFDGAAGLPDALLARASAAGTSELVVATRRTERVARTVQAAAGAHALPAAARQLLDELLPARGPGAARSATAGAATAAAGPAPGWPQP